MSEQALWMLHYHFGGPALTSRTVTHLEFFYARSQEAVQQQVQAFLAEQQARRGVEVFQELLAPCEQGVMVARRFLPGAIQSVGQDITRVDFHWRRRWQQDLCLPYPRTEKQRTTVQEARAEGSAYREERVLARL